MSLEIIEYINALVSIISTIFFLLIPYFIGLFTVKQVNKGIYGKSSVTKTNVFMKIGFVLWFSIITYFVSETVISDDKIRYTTYFIAIIIIILFIIHLMDQLKTIKRG